MKDYFDIFESSYESIINDISWDLKEKDYTYKKNIEKCTIIVEKNPNVRAVIEDKTAMNLSQKEVELMLEWLSCFEENEDKKEREIFYYGARYAYDLLKTMNLLKWEMN